MRFSANCYEKLFSFFFLKDDFVAIEMYNRRIRFVWNVGGGAGIITHPEVLETGNPTDDSLWYRIEAERYLEKTFN